MWPYLPYIAIKMTIFKGFSGIFWGGTESIEQNGLFSAQCSVISFFFSLFVNEKKELFEITSRRNVRYVLMEC
ncbi:MAG TPA: hypothetical protein DDW28_09465 [Prevotella sp.]|nr:hypothetical protein [Candidatus Segatella violae]